jgi:hypothetical protein
LNNKREWKRINLKIKKRERGERIREEAEKIDDVVSDRETGRVPVQNTRG